LSIPGADCRRRYPALVVAFLPHLGGVNTISAFIAFAMAIVVITIGGFGPRTCSLAIEAIAH
jgi:putative MFS transporter